jgi:soluble lytic murein transglycosylase-like protein
MTTPGSTTPSSAQPIRNAPSKPGVRPASMRPAQRPQLGAQQTAFAQALNAAQMTRRANPATLAALAGQQPAIDTGLPGMAGLPAVAGLPGVPGLPGSAGTNPGLGAGTPIAQQLASMQLLGQQRAVPATPTTPPAPARPTLDLPGGFGAIVDQAAKKYGVDPALIAAVMQTESSFNPDAVSKAGARGLMQLMPGTARGLGVTDAHDPLQAVMGGAKLLGQLLDKYNGNTELALAAYNAGSGAVDKFGGIPPYAETRKYVPLVMSAYESFRQQARGASGTSSAAGR